MYIPPFPIEPSEIVGGCIALYKDIWDNPLKDIETMEEVSKNASSGVSFVPAKTINPDGSTQDGQSWRTNSNLGLTDAAHKNDEMRKINNKFFDVVCSAVSNYRNTFGIDENLFWGEGVNVLKYQTGQEYVAHYDGGTYSRRAVSPIVYLNEDYTGGEIEFVNQGVTIKPTAGMLALFPANYAFRHIAHPVKTGTKYAVVTWLHDRNQ
jgi:hypothetical protein